MTRKFIVVGTGVALGLTMLLGFIFLGATTSPAQTDSGVAACQDMANRSNSGAQSSGVMTDEDRKKAREPFEKSSYEELRLAGTQFVDVVYKSQQIVDNEDAGLEETMGVLVAVKTSYGALQNACRAQGVILPDLSV